MVASISGNVRFFVKVDDAVSGTNHINFMTIGSTGSGFSNSIPFYVECISGIANLVSGCCPMFVNAIASGQSVSNVSIFLEGDAYDTNNYIPFFVNAIEEDETIDGNCFIFEDNIFYEILAEVDADGCIIGEIGAANTQRFFVCNSGEYGIDDTLWMFIKNDPHGGIPFYVLGPGTQVTGSQPFYLRGGQTQTGNIGFVLPQVTGIKNRGIKLFARGF